MKLKILFLVLMFVGFFPNISDAAVDVIPAPFSVSVTEIASLPKSGDTLITTQVIPQAKNINYWKVRFYCDDDMKLSLSENGADVCGTAVRFDDLSQTQKFSFIFDNETDAVRKFSFKVKAYDAQGDWMHTIQKSFAWK